jgi:teichoic acid transport system permease protein
VLEHQPIAEYLRLVRMCVLSEPSIPFDWAAWLWCAGWAALTLVGGFVFFWAREETYGRD